MFGKKKAKQQKESLNFKSENYEMKERYNSIDLVVANLEYISSEPTPFGPMVKHTEQRYIFEIIHENGEKRFREIFTGFIADNHGGYFDLPYVINVTPLKDAFNDVSDIIPKYGLLLVLNKVNIKEPSKKLERNHK